MTHEPKNPGFGVILLGGWGGNQKCLVPGSEDVWQKGSSETKVDLNYNSPLVTVCTFGTSAPGGNKILILNLSVLRTVGNRRGGAVFALQRH